MFTHKLDEGIWISFPVLRKSFQVFKDSVNAGFCEQRYSVFCLFVDISVENSLVHETGVVIKQHPAKVVQFQRRQ